MKKALLFSLLSIFTFNLIGQIAVWEFDGDILSVTSTSTGVTGSDAVPQGLTSTTSFFSCNGDAWSPSNWSTAASINISDDYAEYTVTADAGYNLEITGLTFITRSSSSGPTSYSVRSSDDSYASDLLSGSVSGSCTGVGSGFASSIMISSGNSLSIRIYGYNASGSGNMRMDDVTITGTSSPTGPTVGFDDATSSQVENTVSFSVDIPVTMSNYGGSQVDLDVAVTGGTAEPGDYDLNTLSLSFTADGTMNVSVSIYDDADSDDETIELTITENPVTGVTISSAVHTLTIIDDDVPVMFINEFHYDDDGVDDGEFVEIAIESSFSGNLADIEVVLYNGNGGASYDSETLDNFTAGSTFSGYTFYTWETALQNGNDGIALSLSGGLIEFISYEGAFAATNGVANGVTASDVGVSESSTGPAGVSIQRTGNCPTICPIGLTWTGPVTDSPGAVNANQLPIELTSFTAKEKNNVIQLNWQTATEINNSHFEIQHSEDGHTFEILDIVEGAGTTAETQNYSFIDESPLDGINYYRLKQVDYDGAFAYSKIEAVETGTTEDWKLYPTRSQNEVNVEWSEEYSVTTISVFDLTGKRVFEQKISPEETHSTTISTFNFPEGMYFLRMMTNRSVSTKPFFKVQ